jgi:hypothetical protein
MKTIEDTGLIPEAVAARVVETLSGFLHRQGKETESEIISTEEADLIDDLCDQARDCFAASQPFRKMIRGGSGREYLYSFMQHWLASMIKKSHLEIFKSIPSEYCLGASLPQL